MFRKHSLYTLGVCLLISLGSGLTASRAEVRPVVFRTQTMGTWASLTLMTADSAAAADLAYRTLRVFHRVDSLMSNWTDVSEVARINREAGGREVTVHPEVAAVLASAKQVGGESGGAFDITVEPLVRLWGFLGGTPRVPARDDVTALLTRVGQDKVHFDAGTRLLRFSETDLKIDLGGIAKGYGVDAAAQTLRAARTTNALLDLSGNMIALGDGASGAGWWLGIRDPSGTIASLARLRIRDQAIATSGDYEQFVDADGKRYGHILDPRTGWSARGLSSVTVVSRRAMVADAWATALFVLGPEEARRIASARDDLGVVLVEPRDEGPHIIWVENQLRERFELNNAAKTTHTVRHF